jgi:hypothetical protein
MTAKYIIGGVPSDWLIRKTAAEHLRHASFFCA